jgi:hypothetical protein
MLLADYSSDNRCFEFDPNTGAYSHIKLPAPRKDCVGYSGMGQLLRSLAEGKVLVAKYLSFNEAWFSIGAEKWRLFDESVIVKHTDTTFFCDLSVHQYGKWIRKLRYLRRDWIFLIVDPTYDYMDFSLAHLPVDFVPHGLSSVQKQREDFIKMWSSDARANAALNPGAPDDSSPGS